MTPGMAFHYPHRPESMWNEARAADNIQQMQDAVSAAAAANLYVSPKGVASCRACRKVAAARSRVSRLLSERAPA